MFVTVFIFHKDKLNFKQTQISMKSCQERRLIAGRNGNNNIKHVAKRPRRLEINEKHLKENMKAFCKRRKKYRMSKYNHQ